MPITILFADDDGHRRSSVLTLLAPSVNPRLVERLEDLPGACRSGAADLVLLGADASSAARAIAIVEELRRLPAPVPILLVVQGGSERVAVAALRAGVTDYLPYPATREQLHHAIGRCVPATPGLLREPRPADQEPRPAGAQPTLVGSGDAMSGVREYLSQVASAESNVLITGETGTGKELAAAFVHEQSARRLRPFVPVVCAAIPETLLESELFGHEKGAFTGAAAARPGLLQAAHGGTVFLDEVGDIGLPAQAKILRALESRQVYRLGGRAPVALDVRVVAATNRDLEGSVEEGTFRKDLYYRLNVARVHLPPLRERRSDIGQILDYYLGEFNARRRRDVELSRDARQALEAYDWPGNVRELKNVVESLFLAPRNGSVGIGDLPLVMRRRLERFSALGDEERRALLDALFTARWNKSRAAEILHCSRMTLYRRMAKYSVLASERPASSRKA